MAGIKKTMALAMATTALGAMLVAGGSLAIFTSSAQNTNNTFASGTLAISLNNPDGTKYFDISNIAPGDGGASQVTVTNDGSLELRYDLTETLTGALATGANGLKVMIRDSAGSVITPGDINRVLAPGASETLSVSWTLPLDAGNDYQGTSATLGLTVNAEQTQNVVVPTFTTTGDTGIHNGKVYQQFSLEVGGQTISLANTNAQSISLLRPNGSTANLTPDTDPSLWFNVQGEAGNYKYTIVTNAGSTYEATLQWAGVQDVNVVQQNTPPAVQGGITYQAYKLIDASQNEVNLVNFDTMYQIKAPTGGAVTVGGPYEAVPGDTANILWIPINKPAGSYTYLVKHGSVWSQGIFTK